jgi:hypothetical protein
MAPERTKTRWLISPGKIRSTAPGVTLSCQHPGLLSLSSGELESAFRPTVPNRTLQHGHSMFFWNAFNLGGRRRSDSVEQDMPVIFRMNESVKPADEIQIAIVSQWFRSG